MENPNLSLNDDFKEFDDENPNMHLKPNEKEISNSYGGDQSLVETDPK